ncbi:MAG: hypothetical protein VW450_07840, partial [Chloroflexota bacterium]
PVNWLQCQENSVDPVHLEWLHGVYGAHAARLRGYRDAVAEALASFERHKEIGFDRFERGIIKRRAYGNTSKESPKWAVGHPLLFPNILQQGGGGRFFLQFRVPVDDTHTLHIELTSYWLPTDVKAPVQGDHDVPWQYLTLKHPDGEWRSDDTIAQDHIVWILQGPVMDRAAEKLGESDRGLIFFRQMLDEQIDLVAGGAEPMNTFRDPAKNQKLHNDQEGWGRLGANSDMDEVCRYGSQLRGTITGLLSKTAVAASQKNTA